MPGPLISFTTDFGARDPSAAICRGVALGICPDARLLDISHEVEKYAVRDAALLLWCALPYLPVGVHVAVVDPGVGTERAPIALRLSRGDHLVGPDNGLLLPAAERLGGPTAVHRLDAPEFRLPSVSASFHGRDIFTPAGAHLANGVPLEAFGPQLDPATLVPLGWPVASVGPGALEAEAIYVDTFGNVKLGAEPRDLRGAFGAELAFGTELRCLVAVEGRTGRGIAGVRWVETFGRVGRGEPLLYEDSYGRLCLAVREGSFGERYSVGVGTAVRLMRG